MNTGLASEIAQLRQQIEAATNNPQIREATRQITAQFANNPQAELAALQKELAVAMAAGFQATHQKLNETRAELDEVKATVARLHAH